MISLPVKYRPKTLDELVGQEHVVKILKKQVETGKIKNAYLFCGKSGNGKTTAARCFAKAINEGAGAPIEIDAASNNGVDNIRNIIREAQEKSIDSKYKVYIMDEVHVLSSSAWQALLKCLEEPPALTIFILCTTDPQKVPETVLNRVQRFNFGSLSANLIKDRLSYVCECEGYSNYAESIDYISKSANGCMREALSLLGKVADMGSVFDITTTEAVVGGIPHSVFIELINALLDGKDPEVLSILDRVEDRGENLEDFVNQFLKFVLDVAKYIMFGTCDVTSIPHSLEGDIQNIINFENPLNYYDYLMEKLLSLKNTLKSDVDISTTVRVTCLQISRMK